MILKAAGLIRGGWEAMSKQETWEWMSLAESTASTSAHRSLPPFLHPSSLHPSFFHPSMHLASVLSVRFFLLLQMANQPWFITEGLSIKVKTLGKRERGRRSQKIWVRERWKWKGRGKEVYLCVCVCVCVRDWICFLKIIYCQLIKGTWIWNEIKSELEKLWRFKGLNNR